MAYFFLVMLFLYFSDLLRKDVKTIDGKLIGKCDDIILDLKETYPLASGLIVSKGKIFKKFFLVPWEKVNSLDFFIRLNFNLEDVKFDYFHANRDIFSLKRDVLDRQVVDTFNSKVIRVNDIHLLQVDGEIRVAHVDIGIRGLVRRLGLEKIIDFFVKILNPKSSYLSLEDFISWKYVQPLSINHADKGIRLTIDRKQLSGIPPADMSELMLDLDYNHRIALFRSLDPDMKARVFESLSFENQELILKGLEIKEAVEIISNMSNDEAADLLDNLPKDVVESLLVLLETTKAKKLSTILGYSSDSAGGLMTTEILSISDGSSVKEALDIIKTKSEDVETIYYIYIVNDKHQLIGATTLSRLIAALPDDNIKKTMFQKPLFVKLNDSLKEVAYLMDKYKCHALPVIDKDKIVHGIITIDDVLNQVISLAWRKRPKREK